MASVPLIFAEEGVEDGRKEDIFTNFDHNFARNDNIYNANIQIRMAFLRKVYGLLSMQLLMTVFVALIFMVCEPIKFFIQQNTWTIYVSCFLMIGITIPLYIKRKDHPANLILLSAFTLSMAYSIGVLVSLIDKSIVLEALFITLTVVIGLTAYTFQTKRDFTFLSSALFTGLCVLIVAGFLQIFIHNTLLELAICIGGILLFSLYIIVDTQLLMLRHSPEEYILATIHLYVDIINLFLRILQLIMILKK
ncbi:protein lifeguard 4 [Cephus cinctus]|uniref:Protein lifeguard 4 n=1 Tax=Cephus cinctus TaxID=211228 RepID=A0AAJ7BQW4_CEPCN|nr:protein lifeguard 4 [Cephus cinctus]XP_015592118.1 protein lifeguard 4 [Cephus cinctus]XP_015592119.1 protein lifeguard 4 [Cephus cinctus]XP_015592120.1 protein lifeguard 4 [Cephus cinctus]XP_015592121.1 protein lifeguard 4 [Cephus cinctus]XP_015592122.1 protein lifeguard 4 [Cephus cinctus]XP_015592123.1 protein lifeguard 4 [Cephus cinctus]